LWPETGWNDDLWLQELRDNPALIIEMLVDVHNRLHDETNPIPVMTLKKAKWICQHFFPKNDWRQDLDQLINLCSEVGAKKTAKALRMEYRFLCGSKTDN